MNSIWGIILIVGIICLAAKTSIKKDQREKQERKSNTTEDMIQCSYCHGFVDSHNRFCSQCGKLIEKADENIENTNIETASVIDATEGNIDKTLSPNYCPKGHFVDNPISAFCPEHGLALINAPVNEIKENKEITSEIVQEAEIEQDQKGVFICPFCTEKVDSRNRFCINCGKELTN